MPMTKHFLRVNAKCFMYRHRHRTSRDKKYGAPSHYRSRLNSALASGIWSYACILEHARVVAAEFHSNTMHDSIQLFIFSLQAYRDKAI